MRLAERMVKRMRETKLRDRMRQTLGYSYPWLEPEYRAVDNDITIEQEPIDGSAASLLPLLTKGEIIMLRDPECCGPGPNIGWTLVQLLEDFKRPSVLTVGSQLRVLQSNWNADTGGFEFVDAPNSRLLCGYGNFFRVDEAVHRSALLVVEPDGGIEYPADSSVLFLCKPKHEQVTEFNRITRRDSARPDWQHEWWLPVKPESERPQWQGARVVDLHEREYVLAEEPVGDINPDARRSGRVRYTPRPPAAPAALPTVPTRGRGRGRRGRRWRVRLGRRSAAATRAANAVGSAAAALRMRRRLSRGRAPNASRRPSQGRRVPRTRRRLDRGRAPRPRTLPARPRPLVCVCVCVCYVIVFVLFPVAKCPIFRVCVSCIRKPARVARGLEARGLATVAHGSRRSSSSAVRSGGRWW